MSAKSDSSLLSVAVIGGGAAGCFCASAIAARHPDWKVSIYEAQKKPMAKIALTGGGRCNITNSFEQVRSVEEVYPRGATLMKRALKSFPPRKTLEWFEQRGVEFVTQSDGCVFPKSQDAMQIVRCLERELRVCGVSLNCGARIDAILPSPEGGFCLKSGSQVFHSDKVIVTVGGCSTGKLRSLLPEGIALSESCPSLFTFRLDDPALKSLMGTVVDRVRLGIAAEGLRSEGTLLITDWGVSGPAVLRLSSYAAVYLKRHDYRAPLIINWCDMSQEETSALLEELRQKGSKSGRILANLRPEAFSERLWKYLLQRSGLDSGKRWAELGQKGLRRLAGTLCADSQTITGRAAFKEEFVTCGGVNLEEVKLSSLESRRYPGLFFAGEALDVDALTGGFNLQAAWSGAMCVAEHI